MRLMHVPGHVKGLKALGSAPSMGLAAGFAVGFAISWNIASVGAVAPTMAEHYGVTLASIGAFGSAIFLPQVVLQIPGGRLIDRIGTRRAGFVSALLAAGANAGALFIAHVGVALALRAVVGFAVGLGFVTGVRIVQQAGGTALAQGLYGGVALGGAGLAVAVVALVEPALGWQAPYMTGVVAALPALALLAFLEPRPRGASGQTPSLRRLAGNTLLLRLGAVHAASFGFSVVLGNWAVVLLRERGFSTAVAGIAGSLVLAGGLVGRPLGGWVVREWPRGIRSLIAGSLLGGGVALVMLAVDLPAPFTVTATLLAGLALGLPFGAVFSAAARAEPRAPAAAVAITNTLAVTVIVIATPLLGLTFDSRFGGGLGVAVLAVLCAGVAALAPSTAGWERR